MESAKATIITGSEPAAAAGGSIWEISDYRLKEEVYV